MFNNLNETERGRVRAVINSLLACNLMTREHDREKYLAARRHADKIKAYFEFIGWDVVIDERYEYVYAASPEAGHRRPMDRDESIWLLILRLLYEEKRKGLNISEYPLVTLREIQAKYVAFRLPPLKKTNLTQLLRLATQYRLADAIDDDLTDDECRFRLFHTLVIAIDGSQLPDVAKQLERYQLIEEEEPADETITETESN